jgi:hypothetical protein
MKKGRASRSATCRRVSFAKPPFGWIPLLHCPLNSEGCESTTRRCIYPLLYLHKMASLVCNATG